MENNNGRKIKLHEEVARNTANILSIKDDVKEIKIQVTNHIPTFIKDMKKDLAKKIDDHCVDSDKKYAAKWVEKLITYVVLAIFGILLAAGLSYIVISK